MRVSFWSILWLACCAASSFAGDTQLVFERDVRPILKTHCFHCHGEEEKREAGLDSRLVRHLTAGGDSGAAIVAGSAKDSLLWQRIESGEMPPKGKLSDAEKHAIRDWIEQGAKTARPEPTGNINETEWTDEERSYWAFQPVVRPALPTVKNTQQLRTPIDNFLLAELESQGRSFSSLADRATLARRLAFDLLGLPLTPERMASFIANDSPDAYDQLVDELLASPAYGERWARHWLDPAGYADSDGYTENDRERRWAFRYRDYVIKSLNQDKPFDDFLVEQLAGDELVPQPYQNLSSDDIDRLTATGFLRTAPDGTGDVGDQNVARNDVVAETVKIVSTSILGITVGCAQCHSHRYDPISHHDYHRIRALFEPALDWKNWRDHGARQVNLWTSEEHATAAKVDQELREIEGQRSAALQEIVNGIFEKVVASLTAEQQVVAREAKATAADKRTPVHQQILKDYPRLNVDGGSAILYEPKLIADHNKKFEDMIAAAKAKRPADNFIACLTEVPGHKPVTYRFSRGDPQQPRDEVAPGELSVLPTAYIPDDDPSLPTTGRRLAFARHLTSGGHPLVARNLVNRFWMHHFGRGIVPTPGDFGRLGESPSHPALLDWLADEFVQRGWSLKALHRLIVRSAAYQQSSVRSGSDTDTENRYWGRMSVRRLEAEAIRDAMLEVSGMRTAVMYGPSSPVNPDEFGQVVIGNATRDGNGIMVTKSDDTPEKFRRSLYIQVRRSLPLGMLEPFDMAAVSPNCDRRASSTVAPQSLLMMNNEVVLTLADRFANRVEREVGSEPAAQVARAWSLAFGTQPDQNELQAGIGLILSERQHFQRVADAIAAASPPNEKSKDKPSSMASPEQQALALLCQAFFSSNRFLYVD
ncbi:MAG: PSD1 and planctomycete cytochrome C domain-containing protein [Pirellulaceae bacterium]|nr:PSD1 and planctomycete cytochrome C domain-containing protein [Pirellulaceae bacterium]